MSPLRVACVFPGQGSQRKGMGAELFNRYPDLCAAADEILGYSIRELCLEDPGRKLRFTAFTQPALYVANALTWLARAEEKPPPDYLAGHSLGEYDALFAAGCFDFETGLRLVQRRGALMSRIENGGMAAVLGLDAARVVEVLRRQGAPVDVANFNLSSQLVLAGPKADLENLIQPMEAAGARKCLLLNVSGAFHSRYMAPAAAELESFLEDFQFSAPRIEVIANTSAKPYTGSVARHLADQMRSPVRWAQTMEYLRDHGVTGIEELGPGKVLQKLWAKASSEASAANVRPQDGAAGEAAAEKLGDSTFRRDLGLRYAYVAGAPTAGVRTPELVTRLGQQGMLGFLDVAPEPPDAVAQAIREVVSTLGPEGSFGVTLRPPAGDAPAGEATEEDRRVVAALEQGVRVAEAAGYHRVTPALVRFRFTGARRDASGPVAVRHLLVQVARPSTAALFIRPAPEEVVAGLVARGELTAEEGEVARQLPLATDLCAMAGTADGADLATLLPSLQRLRDQAHGASSVAKRIRVGAGGALGTPETIACAFFLGADFVQTGAVNTASVEAGAPPAVKQLLAGLEAGDTADVPAVDGFMLGARTRAVKKGSLFVTRARKLYQLFRFYDSLDAIDPAQRQELETHCFKRSLASVWEDLRDRHPEAVDDPKHQMALVFGWYLEQSLRWALEGDEAEKLNYQIPCDESMAAFNLFAQGTPLADPAGRTVVAIAEALMREAAAFLAERALRKGHPP